MAIDDEPNFFCAVLMLAPLAVSVRAAPDESTSVSPWSSRTTLEKNGSEAAPGVTLADADEYGPVPAAVTAAARNVYAVPLVSDVTTAEVAVDVPSANVVHDEPLLLEYCTT
jgi:hypothetical protein